MERLTNEEKRRRGYYQMVKTQLYARPIGERAAANDELP